MPLSAPRLKIHVDMNINKILFSLFILLTSCEDDSFEIKKIFYKEGKSSYSFDGGSIFFEKIPNEKRAILCVGSVTEFNFSKKKDGYAILENSKQMVDPEEILVFTKEGGWVEARFRKDERGGFGYIRLDLARISKIKVSYRLPDLSWETIEVLFE